MRIGIVTQWSDSGAGYVSRAFRDALSSHHEVFIFARGSSKQSTRPMWHEGDVHWASRHPCVSGFSLNEFRRWVHRNRIEAIIFNEQRWWLGVTESQRLGILTGAYIDYYTAETIPLFGLYDFLICNTHRHYSVFSDHPQRIYCPWGTDVTLFSPTPSQTFPAEKIRFFTNAGMGGANAVADPALDRRGTEFALRAMKHVAGDCELIVHSQCPLSECPPSWRDLVSSDRRITFINQTTSPPGLYTRGNVYVYPSRLDGIGLTLPEALSSGLAAIATDSPPMTEFVQDGVNGRLVRVAKTICRHDGYYWPETLVDVDHLASVMQSYVLNPKAAIEHGRMAREIAVKTLDWRQNSLVLNEWIPSRRKTVTLRTADVRNLLDAANRYDFVRQPTPLQQCLLGVRRLARSLTG